MADVPILRAARAALSTFVLGGLLGCAVSTPLRTVPGHGAVAAPGPERPVVVVITHAVLAGDARTAFDEHTRRVSASLDGQPGLLAWTVRRELLGDQVWTLTVWRDEASRASFVASDVHRAAMAAGFPAIRSVRFRRLELPAGELPLGWPRALRLLDEESRGYDGPAASGGRPGAGSRGTS